jgi:hypothetical protein
VKKKGHRMNSGSPAVKQEREEKNHVINNNEDIGMI